MSFKKWFHKICQSVWTIGFVETRIGDILDGSPLQIRWVDIPKDCWYADPFILNVTEEEIELLVEEWSYELERGIISKVVVDRKTNRIVRTKHLLQLDTHLSFPAIYRSEEKIYVCPENSQSGGLHLYQYNPSEESLTYLRCICQLPLTDAVITDIDGDRSLFSTLSESANGNILHVFRRNPATKQYAPTATLSFDENIARNAGHFFEYEGVKYRPAQVCNSAYGQAISLQTVNKEDDSIVFKEVRRLYSTHNSMVNGMHTFNIHQGVIVVDAWGWKAPFLRRLFVDDWGNLRSWLTFWTKL